MEINSILAQIFDALNGLLDKAVLFLFLAGLVIWNSRELVTSARKEIEKALKEAAKEREEQGAGNAEVPDAPGFKREDFKLYLAGAGKALYLWLIQRRSKLLSCCCSGSPPPPAGPRPRACAGSYFISWWAAGFTS